MRLAFRFLGFVILAIGICISASSVSANSYTLKCNSSKDRVWVYDSLASFAVEAKLNCGEAVEVLERVQNYVKIRAQNGIEGYVPESAFSELPAVAHNAQPAPSVAAVAKQVEAKEIAKTAASGSKYLATDAGPRSTENSKPSAPAGFLPGGSLAEMNRNPVVPAKSAAVVAPAPASQLRRADREPKLRVPSTPHVPRVEVVQSTVVEVTSVRQPRVPPCHV